MKKIWLILFLLIVNATCWLQVGRVRQQNAVLRPFAQQAHDIECQQLASQLSHFQLNSKEAKNLQQMITDWCRSQLDNLKCLRASCEVKPLETSEDECVPVQRYHCLIRFYSFPENFEKFLVSLQQNKLPIYVESFQFKRKPLDNHLVKAKINCHWTLPASISNWGIISGF